MIAIITIIATITIIAILAIIATGLRDGRQVRAQEALPRGPLARHILECSIVVIAVTVYYIVLC